MKFLGQRSGLIAASLILARCAIGAGLVLALPPISVDDYFRVFHASWWWDHISFTSSYEWLPGYNYVYGVVIGLTGDTLLAPRIVSLVAVSVLGAVILFQRSLGIAERAVAGVWLLMSPLALLLGSVPLTESVHILALGTGVVMLARFVETGKSLSLLVSGMMYLAACTIRYETWAFLPLYTILAVRRPAVDSSRFFQLILGVLPWLYPFVWTLTLWAIQGEPLLYLHAVENDHFGAGSIKAALSSPIGAMTAFQVLVSAAASAYLLARGRKGSGQPSNSVWALHVLMALVVAGLIVARDSVPSQFPARIFFPSVMLGSVPVARALQIAPWRKLRVGAWALVGGVVAAGAVAVVTVEGGVEEEILEAGEAVRQAFDEGALKDGDHVVVENYLPDAAAMVVFSGKPANVHIDNMGGGDCPPKMLMVMETMCEFPPWAEDTRGAVVLSDGRADAYLQSIGWRERLGNAKWKLMMRPVGAKFPGEGFYVDPRLVTRPSGLGSIRP